LREKKIEAARGLEPATASQSRKSHVSLKEIGVAVLVPQVVGALPWI
jgi:hypothetical protein